MSRINPKKQWLPIGFAVFSLGCIVHFLELFTLWKLYGITLKQDYLIGAYFMGTGAAMAALSNHNILKIQVLSKMEKITLRVYAIHLISVDILKPIDQLIVSALWQFAYIVLVFILSMIFVMVMSRIETIRKVIL